jgi:hypothetical protein
MIRINDYLFTPKDFWNIIKNIGIKSWIGIAVIYAAVMVAQGFTNLSWNFLFFFAFTFAFFYWKINPKVSIFLALFYMGLLTLILVGGNRIIPGASVLVDKFSTLIFLLLIVGVMSQIFGFITSRKKILSESYTGTTWVISEIDTNYLQPPIHSPEISNQEPATAPSHAPAMQSASTEKNKPSSFSRPVPTRLVKKVFRSNQPRKPNMDGIVFNNRIHA